ncbi:MAG: DUF2058 domain-containing protein [Methylococcales bacterium]
MSRSLQDQLLNAGLVSTKQAKQANASKSKQKRQQRNQKTQVKDRTRLEVEQKAAEKVERDLALNRQRDQEKQVRASEAQIRQLVDGNRIVEDNEGEAFHFNHKGIVKKVYVSEPVRLQIINGQLAIVISGNRYRVIPAEIAQKIKARDESALVLWQNPTRPDHYGEIDSAYAQYKIPDDLIW